MTSRFTGKIALVTGAASGIGKAVMHRLCAEGAQVIACDHDKARLDIAVSQSEAGSIDPVVCDVTDPQSVAAAVQGAMARYGRIDILANNAGIAGTVGRLLHEQSIEDFDQVFAVNVRGAFTMLQQVIPVMLAQGGGAIVNTASIAAFRATRSASPYVASKGALLSLTRAAALDYADRNIRINAVCPGATESEILAETPPGFHEMVLGRIPMGRLARADEIAATVAFLASEDASYITGAAYLIDGGRGAS